ncbi:hypothetical protein LCGC14_2142380, partial [marine sediment metagenome]
MAESLKIKGGTTVDLLLTAGISIKGWTPATPENEDNLHEVVRENMSFRIKGTSQNNLASQLIIFKKELRKARQFHTTTWQTTPLYIEAQGSTESNTRYALLHRGRVSNLTTIHETVPKKAFTQSGTLELWREAGWRGAVPGTSQL